MTTQITANNIAAHTITVTQLVPGVLSPKIQTVSICDSSYNVLDDTAANTTGGYIQITGSTFGANSQVIIGTNNATSVTFVNTSTIRAQVPAASATSYPVYVIDADTGATAIKINGLTHSSFPAWSTGSSLSNQAANTSFGVSLSASSDSNITYTNTSALPSGTSLAANGYFSGTVSIAEQTTYSFGIKATDSENQDATRTFSLTVTVIPQNRLWSWGRNLAGELGINNTVYKSSPTQIGSQITWNNIAGGKFFTLATKTDGTLWAWGASNLGTLGINDALNNRSSPTQVGSLTNWNLISAGNYNSLATKTDGTLWSWGFNAGGQLGQNHKNYRSSPTQVGTETTWLNIASVGYHSLATKTDGTLWAWGYNDSGQLGLNTASYRSSPTQVGTETTWLSVAGGFRHSAAIKTDGTLWTWGRNNGGELGLNNVIQQSSPTQVGADTNWSKIDFPSTAANHVLATKTNGTLWAWGRNDYGQLGQNNSVYRSSPVQIGSDTTWSYIAAGFLWSAASKTDGTLWTWGRNHKGQLGQNNGVYRSSPTQVGTGTNWNKISNSEDSLFAITSN